MDAAELLNLTPTSLFGIFTILINFISAFAIFTQIRLTYKRKNTIGLARFPWVMGTTNAFVGLIYALMIDNVPFILANFLWCSVNGIMLALVLYYGKAPASAAVAPVVENPTGANNP